MKQVLDAAVWFIKAISQIAKLVFYIMLLGYVPITMLVSLSAWVTDDPDTDIFAASLWVGLPFYLILLITFGIVSEVSDKRKREEFEKKMKKQQW